MTQNQRSNLERLQNRARVLHGLTVIVLIVVPAYVLLCSLFFPPSPSDLAHNYPEISIDPALPQVRYWAAIFIAWLPFVPFLWTFNQMRKLFLRYRSGEVLSAACAQRIHMVGLGFMAIAIVSFIVHPLLSSTLSFPSEEGGSGSLSIVVNQTFFMNLVVGAFLTVIGWAMGEAAQVAAENKEFV